MRTIDGVVADRAAATPDRVAVATLTEQVTYFAGESEWDESHIGRMGAGREVKPSLNAAGAATGFVAGELSRGLTARRRARLVKSLSAQRARLLACL